MSKGTSIKKKRVAQIGRKRQSYLVLHVVPEDLPVVLPRLPIGRFYYKLRGVDVRKLYNKSRAPKKGRESETKKGTSHQVSKKKGWTSYRSFR